MESWVAGVFMRVMCFSYEQAMDESRREGHDPPLEVRIAHIAPEAVSLAHCVFTGSLRALLVFNGQRLGIRLIQGLSNRVARPDGIEAGGPRALDPEFHLPAVSVVRQVRCGSKRFKQLLSGGFEGHRDASAAARR
jgi:hypothetical protein